ncbi:MAG: hypothetical protein VYA34_10700 [Myxococcota bacterium]|nr:hypothetical protein [Myxococcota bacterium]
MAAKKAASKKAAPKKAAPKKAAPKKKPAAKKKPAVQDMVLVVSKTKDALKASGCNVAGDALDGLNALVHQHIAQAAKRAEANGRKTIRAHDFVA